MKPESFKKSRVVLAVRKPLKKSGRRVQLKVEMGRLGQEAMEYSVSAKSASIVYRLKAWVEQETESRLKKTLATVAFDAMGEALAQAERLKPSVLEVYLNVDENLLEACLSGLEVALYRYRQTSEPGFAVRVWHERKPLSLAQIEKITSRGRAINLARELVNRPPNELQPESYAQLTKAIFNSLKTVKVEIWDEKRLAREGMNLHLAVGKGAGHKPRLVRMSYSPKANDKRAPIALVGKGITFDSGGLDIKPSSAMRLMKKDMGGSAAVVGALYWAALNKLDHPLEGFIALAENAVSAESFHPSDVIQSRNGLSVEIHNTDAEGRLVLADALDVAKTLTKTPKCIVDVATLTGAVKVGLGAKVGGLFANNEKLRDELWEASASAGDWLWPMPLVQSYANSMKSNFADCVNATDGFGGAVTAALFLQKFIGDIPWAHLDIYAWKDAPEGAVLEAGGSGQGVATLVEWLQNYTHGR